MKRDPKKGINMSPEDAARVELGYRRADQVVREQAFTDAEEADTPVEDPGPWDTLELWRKDQAARVFPSEGDHMQVCVVVGPKGKDNKVSPNTPDDQLLVDILDRADAFSRVSGLILRGWILPSNDPAPTTHLTLAHRAMLDLAEDREYATMIATAEQADKWTRQGEIGPIDREVLDLWPDVDPAPVAGFVGGKDNSPDWLILNMGDGDFLICELKDWA